MFLSQNRGSVTSLMLSFVLFLLGLMPQDGIAFPRYAVKHYQVRCTSCHLGPSGGGPLNLNGKAYATRNLKSGPLDRVGWVAGSMRILGFWPENAADKSNGLGLMEASLTGSWIFSRSEGGAEHALVLTNDFGKFGPGPREVYLLSYSGKLTSAFPNRLLLGRFNVPFGLLTDEHKTYTRSQTQTSLNSFEMGVMASGDPAVFLHYDLALLNGFQSGGSLNSEDFRWGLIANLRTDLRVLPIQLGASYIYHYSAEGENPRAYTLYTLFSLGRLTQESLPLTLAMEAVWAQHFNRTTINSSFSSFVPFSQSAIQSALERSTSFGWTVRADLELSSRWTLVGKWEGLALDKGFFGDAFHRVGGGARYQFLAHLYGLLRMEFARTGQSTLDAAGVRPAENRGYFLLRVRI